MPGLRSLSTMGLGGGGGAAPTAGTTSYSSPGSFTFTVPDAVYRLTVALWGAAGGGAHTPSTGQRGGSGGAFVLGFVNVTPGQQIPLVVGAGGVGGGPGTTNGTDGTASTFLTFTANPGLGGIASGGITPGGAAMASATTGLILSHAGGTGPMAGGGAGGPDGPGAAGGNAQPSAGGAGGTSSGFVPAGGAGGGHTNVGVAGTAGVSPGGGGGAATGGTTTSGGNGAAGQVMIWW